MAGVKLNAYQFLMGRDGLNPVATSLYGSNGIDVEKADEVFTIKMDPLADVTFHDITASGNISGANLSGTNTGDVTIEEIGDEPNDAGATIDGQAITLQPASADHGGVLTAGSQVIGGNKTFKGEAFFDDITTVDALNLAHGELQIVGYFTSFPRTVTIPNVGASADFVLTAGNQTIAGTKTFSGNISAANLSGTNSGDVTVTAVGTGDANGLSVSGQVLRLHPASSTTPGVLTTGTQTIAGGKTFTDSMTVQNNISARWIYVGTATQNSLLRLAGFFTDTPRTYTLPDVGADSSFVMTSGDQTIAGTKTFSGNISAANLSGTNTGNVTVTTLGTGNANGLSISGQALTLHGATSTSPGVMTTGFQTISGSKTFTGTLNASNLSGTNTGDVTVTTVGTGNANGMSVSGQALQLHAATSTQPGILTTGTQTIAGAKTFSGAISASNLSGTNTGNVTLTTVGSSPNTSGASLSGQALTLQPCTHVYPGILSTDAQLIGGLKDFAGGISVQNSMVLHTGNLYMVNNVIKMGYADSEISSRLYDGAGVALLFRPGTGFTAAAADQYAMRVYSPIAGMLSGEVHCAVPLKLKNGGSQIDWYSELTVTNNCSGVWSNSPATVACNYKLVRVGKTVTLHLPTCAATGPTSGISGLLQFTNWIPTDYRPSTMMLMHINIIDNGTTKSGVIYIGETGALYIGLGASGTTALPNAYGGVNRCGFWGASFSWTV